MKRLIDQFNATKYSQEKYKKFIRRIWFAIVSNIRRIGSSSMYPKFEISSENQSLCRSFLRLREQ